MRSLYSFGVRLYGAGISLSAIFNEKAAKWKSGRTNLPDHLPENLEGCVWIHCASLGEFEQGRPLIEALKEERGVKILLTFFSPSGYEIRKNYPLADAVVYLPLDTPENAKRFLDKIKPSIAIFVKYEIWHNFFREIGQRGTPLYLISAIFRPDQIYFKPYGKWFAQTLQGVNHFFCQDQKSAELLKEKGINQVTVAGDTRFDRVVKLAEEGKPIPEIEEWLKGRPALVIGSSWPADEKIINSSLEVLSDDFALIFAPHEIKAEKVERLKQMLGGADLFTELPSTEAPSRFLIVNTIGLLSRIYRYGQLAYIGGGFGAGIHNTLEAAVYGIPVVFGPEYKKFKEAVGLIDEGAAFSVRDEDELRKVLHQITGDEDFRKKSGASARNYVMANAGATRLILEKLQKPT